ncbi:winged helix-turn-helix domain-containing protein [Methanolobus mangrovi]|uniref:Winged helix-turn-helix domain-containing protein n=1 Tax=Methanolobus mangrovi TaxID=3072977 RepID=A0AA51UGC0_9EURY|nr:winged helix-turn-helix domain-containing protein [Methanolobus mangrovi]WMW22671.1 winged helix-turn-helix domain-containing protein [Methanolobus mangrovi]
MGSCRWRKETVTSGCGYIRRSRTAISVEILKAALEGAKKTHIVYSANLNFDMVNRYLEMLEEKGLLEHKGNLYITTAKGKEFQEIAKELGL